MQVATMKMPTKTRHLVILLLIWRRSELSVVVLISIPLWRQSLIQAGRFWPTLKFPVLRRVLTVPDSMKGFMKSPTNTGPVQMGKG